MMISLEPTTWVRSPRPLPKAQYRLFCLPYGGGDATLFHDWPDLLPAAMRDRVEICTIHLPGHTHRADEQPLFTTIAALVDVLVPRRLSDSVLAPYLDRPFALFGASLGGLIMFEVARALTLHYHVSPMALCVAACRAPHLAGPAILEGGKHLQDVEWIEHILESDDERASKGAINPLHTILYAEALLGSTYLHIPGPALNCPIALWGGIQDELVSRAELGAWQSHTTSTFHPHWLPGKHFFVRDASAQIRARLLDQITRTFWPMPTSTPFPTPLVRRINHIPARASQGNNVLNEMFQSSSEKVSYVR